jgi:hypothetical protein
MGVGVALFVPNCILSVSYRIQTEYLNAVLTFDRTSFMVGVLTYDVTPTPSILRTQRAQRWRAISLPFETPMQHHVILNGIVSVANHSVLYADDIRMTSH